MRKNKKLLLGGLSVLTLVAAGSGAVSTFAWYQSSASATAAGKQATGTLTSSVTITSIAVDITVTLDEIDANGTLASAENPNPAFAQRSNILQQVAINSAAGPVYSTYHAYYADNTTDNLVPYDGESTLWDYAVYKVSVKQADATKAAAIAGAAKDVQTSIATTTAQGLDANDTDRLLGYVTSANLTAKGALANATAYGAQTSQNSTYTTTAYNKTASQWQSGFDAGYVVVFFHGTANNDLRAALTGSVTVKAELIDHA